MSDFYFNPDGSYELYHYGVPGMRWGQRKTYGTSSIMPRKTWDDRLRDQQRRERHGDGGINGNASSSNMKRKRYQSDFKYRQKINNQRMDKAVGTAKKIKSSLKSETVKNAVPKGKKAINITSKSLRQIAKNKKRQEKGKEIARKLLDPREQVLIDGYQKQRKPIGTITDGYTKRKLPGKPRY